MSAQGDQQGGATNASASGSWWGWGDSLLQTVKKQSETIISIYKEDLSEFTRTIKEDTLNVVKEVVHTTQEGTAAAVASSSASTSTAASQRPNAGAGGRGGASSSSGLSNFFNFMESLKDEEEEEVLAKSRREKAIKKLQKDINTFTKEPDDAEDFKAWKAGFNLEARTVDISQLLAANNKLRAIHNELLPKLTYSVFWERYYYRLEKILKEEERREKILMRAELDSKLDDWEGWEDEEEPAGASTLSASADSTETSAVDDEEEPVQEGAERESVPHGGSDEPSLEGNTPSVDSIPELDPAPVTDDAPPVAPSSSGSTTPQKTSGQQEASSSGPAVIAKEEVDDEKNNAEDEIAASESAEEPPAQNVDEDALLEEELARRSLEGITEQPADEENKDDDWDAWE